MPLSEFWSPVEDLKLPNDIKVNLQPPSAIRADLKPSSDSNAHLKPNLRGSVGEFKTEKKEALGFWGSRKIQTNDDEELKGSSFETVMLDDGRIHLYG